MYIDCPTHKHLKYLQVEIVEELTNNQVLVKVLDHKKFNIKPKKVYRYNNSTLKIHYENNFLSGFTFKIDKYFLKD